MTTKLQTLRTEIIKYVKDMEQERHRLFFPQNTQNIEKQAKYNYVSKYQTQFLKLLSEIDGEDYVKAHAQGKLSTVLSEFGQ